MTSFRILGPIEVWSDERRVDVGGPRQIALLAYLLLHANRAVPSDALVDALWGPERTANDNRLHMAIARLRKALAPLDGPDGPGLRTVRGGYLFELKVGELDTEAFATQVKEGFAALDAGDAERAASVLSDAETTWWRGPPLAEVAFEDFARSEIRKLEGLRLSATEARIDAELQLGRHARLVSELEARLAADPIDERLAAQLMLALYRSGRQSDALEVYQRLRVQLAEQLGIEPGPALRELQAEILQQSPALDGRATGVARATPSEPLSTEVPVPSRLEPYGPAVFVDRRAEREALTRALDDASAEGRRTAFVTGEAGIGKTRLVSEVAWAAHAAGTLVLAGRCDDGLDLPYQPFVEALEHLVEHAPVALLEDHIATYGDSVARLVPALASRVPVSPQPALRASESERYVLYRAIEGLLSVAAEDGGVLLVLEDLHWADVPTLKLLRRLLGSPRRSSLMMLCTCRVRELDEHHPLRALLADLFREPHALRLDLGGLATRDVAELLTGIGGDPIDRPAPELVTTLEAGTDGNPFFITELVHSLMETGALEHHDGRWQMSSDVDPTGDLPVSIAETLARRLLRLDDDVRTCVRVAAVVGAEFDLDLVSGLVDVQSPGDALDTAVEASVLRPVPGRAARFRFAHALMQRFLYRELGAARRAQLHGRLADLIEARFDEGQWPLAEMARHCLAAGPAYEARALRYATLAGDEALAKLAPDEAQRSYQVALDLLARRRPAERQVCDLLVRRGEAERQAGDPRFRDTLLEAAELARRLADGPLLVRAALANTRGMQSETGVVDAERLATVEAALLSVGEADTPERARLLAMQAAELMYAPSDWERRRGLSDEALSIARRIGDPDALSRVLNLRFVTLLAPCTHAERRDNADEAVQVAERHGDPLARFYAFHWRGYASVEAGEIKEAGQWLDRERELADRFRQPTALWLARADEANLKIVAGELDFADRLASAALELGRHSEPDALACYVAQRTSIAFEAGRLGELVPMLERAVEDNPGVPGFRATLALALCEVERAEPARALLDSVARTRFRDVPRDVAWLTVMCLYAQVSSRLGELSSARQLYELLEPSADQVAFPAFGVWGPVTLYLGSLALALGEVDRAERHLAAAALLASTAGAPCWGARVVAESMRFDAGSE